MSVPGLTALRVELIRQPSLDLYPPLPATGEAPLRRIIDGCACACGRYIVQYAGDSRTDAVSSHNATPEHRGWRRIDSGTAAEASARKSSAPPSLPTRGLATMDSGSDARPPGDQTCQR